MQTAALFAPAALIVGLALGGGGFDVAGRHIAGLAVWLTVVALLVLGAGSRARLGRPLYWATGLFVCLAALCAISSVWSGSTELSVIEADRVLVYLGFFLAAFLIAQTDETGQRFAEGIAIGVTITVFLGLASRLLPHVVEVSNGLGSGPRLRYPLGYWNANGAMCAIAVPMLLWLSRRGGWRALRWGAVGVLPGVLLTLYFTYSRGGLLAIAIGTIAILALSRDRLWMLATAAIGTLGSLPALLAVQSRGGVSDNLAESATIGQGVEVLLFLFGGIALSLALFAILRRVEARSGRRTGRAVELSRDPRVLRGAAVALAVVAIGAVVVVGSRASHQFSSPDIEFPNQPSQHFSELSSAGRSDYWRVAIDAFKEKPVLGLGAGTYQFAWNQNRSIDLAALDAHSLYLESFAELGIVGGLLVLALVGSLLWTGFGAWRAARGAAREAYAALLVAALVFAAAASIDWFWEIADLAGVFFLAAGALTAARCRQPAAVPAAPAANGGPRRDRRFAAAVAGMALAWASAIALVGPLLVEREIDASQSSVSDGNLVTAVDHAETARSIEPWAASPYLQLGLVAEQRGELDVAVERLGQAIDREDRNWELYALRSRVESEAGETAAAEADLREARRLNPRAPQLRSGGE